MSRFPALFVPHGAPTFALRPGAAGAALSQLASDLPTPRAILIVSAHWETEIPTLACAEHLETIHDFWGFPEALYALRYPASGNQEAATQVATVLAEAGFPASLDTQRGLDHGAWVPLRLMYPAADIPVIALSLPRHGGPAQALALGQALAPLADEGFLIIGSGSITHNLRDYQLAAMNGGQTPTYVHDFADWVATRLASGEIAALLDYRQQAADGARAHPSEEHFLPFFVALGAGGENAQARRFYAGVDDFVIAMDGYAFAPAVHH